MKTLGVRVDDETYAKIEAERRRRGVTRSRIARAILRGGTRDLEDAEYLELEDDRSTRELLQAIAAEVKEIREFLGM